MDPGLERRHGESLLSGDQVHLGHERDLAIGKEGIDLSPVCTDKPGLDGEIVGPCRVSQRISLNKAWISGVPHVVWEIAVVDDPFAAHLGSRAHKDMINMTANG